MNRLFCQVWIVAGLCLCNWAAAEVLTEDLFELSLEELLNVKVSVSSNYQQSLRRSPGIVRIIDQQMITKNGWRNLQQLLMHIPGVQISVSKNGHSNIWVRGVQNRNNNKLLLLVDGVPQNDSYYGNFHVNNQLPLQQIERVEVLNGPGGVVHGANSFAGVIAITTRSKGRRIGARVGQQSSYISVDDSESVVDGQIYGDYDWQSDFGSFYLFADTLDQQGFQPQYNREGEFYARDVDAQRHYLLGKYSYKSLDIQLNYSDYEYPYRHTKSNRWQGYDKQLFTAVANYKHQINEVLQLKLSAFYKNYDFRRPKTFYDESRIEASGESLHDTSAEGFDAILLWPASDQRHASFGLSYNRNWARNTFEKNTDYPLTSAPITVKEGSLIEDTSRNVLGLFTEYQQQLLVGHWLHLGLRYDDLSDFDNQFSYRISLTRESEMFYYKILFGTSYRVPSYREYLKKYNEDYTQKNPLQPEQIETMELAAGFTPNQHEILLVWYFNRYQDFIKEVTINSVDGVEIDNDDGDEYGFNFDEIEVSGLELSWSWRPVEGLSFSSSLSYLLEASEDPGTLKNTIVSPSPISTEKNELLFLSDFTASVQINYQFSSRYQLYFDVIYYSDRDVPANYQADSAIQQPDNASGFWLSNMHIQAKINKSLKFGLALNNLFDADIYSPPLDPASDYDNQLPGRHIELSTQWQF